MWGPIAAIAIAGLVTVVALAFWAELQNWMAGVIDRARLTLGPIATILQSALVVLDRLMVNGQRVIVATGRTTFAEEGTHKIIVREELRELNTEALPTDILAKLDKGQSLTYGISGDGT
ncbi:MAG: hypothetical protein ABI947_08800 [Chloroflexota bacterium]